MEQARCPWCLGQPIYQAYHDEEWGVPVHDDQRLFEFLVLEGAQAGLSWLTILRRREGYRRAYQGFDPAVVAAFGPRDVTRLQQDPGIIRNHRKITGSIRNAAAFLKIQEEHGSFARYIWGFVEGQPIVNHWSRPEQVPATTPLAARISRDLIGHGFCFVGPVIVYAHLQATGLVNDHLVSCFRHAELQAGTAPRLTGSAARRGGAGPRRGSGPR